MAREHFGDDEVQWPDADLEHLGKCPICGSASRILLFDDLEDWTFRVVPGKWTLWNCVHCTTAYLDPRPNEASIGRAYETYYTHPEGHGPAHETVIRSLTRRLKRKMHNGYLGLESGHSSSPLERTVGRVLRLFPDKTSVTDLMVRHLPLPVGKQKVLDVGSGGGEFLREAAGIGYLPIGLEPDAKAVTAGRAAGFEVQPGGLPDTGFPAASFSHITLNHVFEHLHRPLDALAELWRILEPGGRLWMAMPNRDALGFELFGKYWRGLEAPRHLSLVTAKRLRLLLEQSSFHDIAFLPHPPCGMFFAQSSLAQKAGLDPYGVAAMHMAKSPQVRSLARQLDRQRKTHPEQAEILIVTAHKNIRRPD
jgi:SAM-dependent methyltransferase